MATVELQDNQFAFMYDGQVIRGMLQGFSSQSWAGQTTYQVNGIQVSTDLLSRVRQMPVPEPEPTPEPLVAAHVDTAGRGGLDTTGRRLLPLEDD